MGEVAQPGGDSAETEGVEGRVSGRGRRQKGSGGEGRVGKERKKKGGGRDGEE